MRASWGVFLILFLSAAWFHQGGGWNQNVRFDQVRAMAEDGSLAVDDHILYLLERRPDGVPDYRRVRLSDPETRLTQLPDVNSLDLSAHDGRFYPAKAPGVGFLAVPGYFVVHGLERVLGIDPDSWWPLTVNLYLTTLLSVGLLGALGGVVFLGLARRLFPDVGDGARIAAALTLGLGTLWLPYATMLFDHVAVAALSLVSLALIRSAGRSEARRAWRLLGAGAACGVMVVLNYGVVLTVACLGVFALAVCRPRHHVAYFVAGGVLPALALGAYHQVCFGSPFSIAYAHELDIFRTESAPFLGVFDVPDPVVLVRLLFGPYRGLLFTSPVLAFAGGGVVAMIRSPATRREGVLAAAVTTIYLLQVSAFNGWHGGSAIGPRYLMPAVPFLALGLVPAFARLPRLTGAFAVLSAAIMLLVTAVDPQVDVEIERPLTEYYLPLAAGGSLRWGDWVVRGPVSVQTLGAAGGRLELLDPDGRFARWNSFNLGEFWLGHGWLSLAPLLLAWGAIAALCFRGPASHRAAGPPGAVG